MTRRCSHCSNNGHNSRTCPSRGGGGVKLFGVRLTDGSIIKKSASMGNLSSALYHSSSSAAASPNSGSPSSDLHRDSVHDVPDGYLSDDPAHASCSAKSRADRKKGIPWTEEEHRLFLLGLQKLGKGDWRGISRNYVTSRTPTQVASHAQKYFIRQNNATRRKRRSSLFDMVPELATDLPPMSEGQVSQTSQEIESDSLNALPSLNLSLKPDFDSMENTTHEMTEETKETAMATEEIPEIIPSFIPAYIPLSFSLWPSNAYPLKEEMEAEKSHHQVLKPVPVLPKEPVNGDELVGMSQLSLRETETSHAEPPLLSLSLPTDPSRQSAFQARTPVSRPNVNTGNSSVVKAV